MFDLKDNLPQKLTRFRSIISLQELRQRVIRPCRPVNDSARQNPPNQANLFFQLTNRLNQVVRPQESNCFPIDFRRMTSLYPLYVSFRIVRLPLYRHKYMPFASYNFKRITHFLLPQNFIFALFSLGG